VKLQFREVFEPFVKNLYPTHPMKKDVKKKSFSPPLWEMRAW
jgi:hypothetical protein